MRCGPGAAACRMAALLLPESARFIAARSRMLFSAFSSRSPHARRPGCRAGARPKGALTQENIGFGLTILAPSAFKKPGNPSGLPGFFHATIHPKLPGQNCFAPLKQKLGLQSKEKRRRHPLWLSRRFDNTMRPNFCFRGNVFLRQRAFWRRALFVFHIPAQPCHAAGGTAPQALTNGARAETSVKSTGVS